MPQQFLGKKCGKNDQLSKQLEVITVIQCINDIMQQKCNHSYERISGSRQEFGLQALTNFLPLFPSKYIYYRHELQHKLC